MKNKINYKLLFLMTGLISACSTTIDDGMLNEHEAVENSATVTAPANEEDQNTISILSLPKEQQERVGSYSDYEAIKPKDASVVSLNEVAQMVVSYHPRIAQSLAEAKGQEDMIDVAAAGYYPQISDGMNMGYDKNSSGAGSTNARAVSVEVRQTLYDFGKTANQVKSAELGFEGAKTQSTIT